MPHSEQVPQLDNQQESSFNLNSNLQQFEESTIDRGALEYLKGQITKTLGKDEEGNLNSIETI